jgi:hypothetical protein
MVNAMEHRNPFPGMNPFMERRWRDVHLKLIAFISNELGVEMPESYSALAEEQVHVFGDDAGVYYPDISIVDEPWKRGLPPVWTPEHESGVDRVVAEPEIVNVETPPERWIEVRHDDGTLVTVIEVISPTNRESGRLAFLTKRRDYIAAGVNVVEIDLLRQGRRLIDLDARDYQRRFPNAGEHYTVCAIRAGMPDRREIYICTLRQRLPVIRVPLRAPDPDVPLDLQKMLDRVYESGRYWKLNYQEPLDPALPEAEQSWVAEQLRKSGFVA